jgi:uncharacterized repeat protein (TIGR01451 family)
VSKSGPGQVAPNTQFSYTVGIANVGSATATAVEVEDQLPATFLSVSPPNLCAPFPGNLLRCFNLVIPAGQSVTLTIRVQSPSSQTTLRNTARAWWGNPRQGPAVSNTVSTSVRLRTDEPGGGRIAVKTFLDIEPYDGRSRGRVVFNGSEAFEVENRSPVIHHVAAGDGDNTVEGTVLASPDRSRGFWRFDFSAAGRFDPGSLRVESGQVYSMDERSVTFSVAEGSLVRFRYGIRSDSP